ncbi:MAG: GDSL-type esterase/lipase family protein [Elusimicrobiota bacterium]|jgi:lysophospholipase L1-like esterase|nr:GDSL-type esterase/lipase family protein [Elusimicrobiota bacterium]
MKKLLITLFAAFALAACGGGPLNQGNSGREIIAFGDSITDGHGVADGQDYPSLLTAKTGKRVINLGVSGDTMAQGRARMREIAGYRPYMVLIEFGGNDAIRSRPFTQTEESLTAIIDYVQSLGAIAVVVDTGGNFKMNPYSKMFKRIAKEKRALFVPAIMDGIFYKPALKSDAIHPNAAGHQKIADKIYKHIKDYL